MTQREIYDWGRVIHDEVSTHGANALYIQHLIAEIVRQATDLTPRQMAIADLVGRLPEGAKITVELPVI